MAESKIVVAASRAVKGSAEPSGIAMRIDFAHALGSRLVVCGWVAGLSEAVASAELLVGDMKLDVLADAVRMKRPDVARSVRNQGFSGDEHGFLALLEKPGTALQSQILSLVVRLHSGAQAETESPIIHDEAIAVATLRAHESVLRPMIPRLSARQKKVLLGFGSRPPLAFRTDDLSDAVTETPSALPANIGLCAVLEGGVLVVGGLLPRPYGEISQLVIIWQGLRFDLLASLIRVEELAARGETEGRPEAIERSPYAFFYTAALPEGVVPKDRELRVSFTSVQGHVSLKLTPGLDPLEAGHQFRAHLATLGANSRLEICERISTLTPGLPGVPGRSELIAAEISKAVQDLPRVLDVDGPPYAVKMHVDRAIQVADVGIYVIGWFQADPKSRARVICNGEGGDFNVSAHWVRWVRPDVEKYLGTIGLPVTEDPGFFCFIPIRRGQRPYYFSIGARSGRVWRIQVPAPDVEPVPQAIRAVLATVDPERGELRRLLDEHVGPAVSALWAAHSPSRQRALVERFGPQPSSAQVSIVVPLYGRHDFVDYQLALFADDPDFRNVELIYVVDDPAILQDFRLLCPDLFSFYRVPFTLAFPGDNLGFAGATNFGATLARAPYLLLLNSDVMPKGPGWLGEMLRIYAAYPDTGLLGAKLLYEDGTVQHAGMESRRSKYWHDLWINAYPYKGLSPAGLSGILEAECVTAACALVETGLYRAVGGLSEHYIVGDFEDSDLCHNLRGHGRRNRVALDVVLYHLERQSQSLAGDPEWRTALSIYNCWVHNRRWGGAISGVAA